MIRSAKMNATTPPKLMPALPQHHGQRHVADRADERHDRHHGPMIGPHTLAASGCPAKKNACQNESGTQAAIAPAASRPMTRSRRIAAHSITKTCGHRGVPVPGQQPPQERPVALHRHVHGRVALHRPGQAAVGLLAGLAQQLLPQEQPEPHGHQHDHDRAADELGQRELPAHQQGQDHAQLDDQVGRGDLERHGRGEARALAEQRAGQRHRGVGAEDEAAPSPAATASVRGRSSPSSRTIVDRRTTACTMADSAKPRISAQAICQVMEPGDGQGVDDRVHGASSYP